MAPYFPEVFSIAEPLDVQIVCDQYDLTTEQLTSLSTLAQAAKATAYCPYSRFRVGATILHTDGSFTSGANVENAAYPVGTCAERVAFGKAVTELAAAEGANDDVTGEGKGRFQMGVFKALAVATDITPPASPCGMCRQFIREFCELDLPILMFDKDGKFCVMRLQQLLPLSFGPEALPPPASLPA